MIQKLTNKLNDRKNNKGFTLVELIVVIVILAILAAILIPGLLKWIDEAKDKQYQLEARSIYMATQAVIAEKYNGSAATTGVVSLDANGISRVTDLSGLSVTSVKYESKEDGTITKFETEFTSSGATGTVTWSWVTGGQWKEGSL